MKKLAALLTMGAVFGMASAHADLLTNGDFETGDITGWNGGGDASGAPGIGAQSGVFALELTLAADGVAEVNQGAFGGANGIIAASPGQEFNFSGWFLTETALPPVGTGATFGLFKIVFEDATGADLEPASVSIGQFGPAANPGAEALPFLDGNSPVNEWIFAETQAVAPAGTASAQFLALNVDFGNGANHPMYFDNIVATVVPEPGSLALIGFGALALGLYRRRT